jgi:hypothetical protein
MDQPQFEQIQKQETAYSNVVSARHAGILGLCEQ